MREGVNWLFLRRLACLPAAAALPIWLKLNLKKEGEEASAASEAICNCRRNLILYPCAV